jgi:hypothetical protein
MAAASKVSSFLPDLRKFAANLSTVSYDALLNTAAEAGWQTFYQQVDAIGQTDGTVLVTFQVFVGREDKFDPFDMISVKVSPGPGPVSAVARRIAADSLVPLFFGRYPQVAPTTPPAPVQTARMDDVDIVLKDDEQEYLEDQPAAPIRVVDHLEPDGVPIFVDLYALGDPSADVIQSVLNTIDDFLERAQSVETINAMGAKNPMMIKFIKDLGTPEDSAEFMRMVETRRNMVKPPVLSNARRRVSAEKSN